MVADFSLYKADKRFDSIHQVAIKNHPGNYRNPVLKQ